MAPQTADRLGFEPVPPSAEATSPAVQALDGSVGLSDLPGPWHMSFRAQMGSWGYKAAGGGVGGARCSPLFLDDPLLEKVLGGLRAKAQPPGATDTTWLPQP